VKEVEGQINDPRSALFSGAVELTGMKVTDALNKCHAAGYDFLTTEDDGEKKIYRLKLRT
jgi:hypothetical protein